MYVPGPSITGLRAILGPPPLDGELSSQLQVLTTPALPCQGVWRPSFALPFRHRAAGVAHIEVDPDVWIAPVDLGDDPLEHHRLVAVELRGKGVMTRHRERQQERDDERHEGVDYPFHGFSIGCSSVTHRPAANRVISR